MAGVLFTITASDGAPSLARASEILGVEESALDTKFGVQLIDPRQNLYAVMVEQSEAPQAREDEESVKGPFSNPVISDFGPPRKKK
jgi:hypothetical protein